MAKALTKMAIPKICTLEVLQRYEKIKPIISIKGTKYYTTPLGMYDFDSYHVIFNINRFKGDVFNEDDFEYTEKDDMYLLSKIIDTSIFEPIVSDIYAQIPAEYLDKYDYFEIINYPKCLSDFSKDNMTKFATAKGYAIITARFYRHKL